MIAEPTPCKEPRRALAPLTTAPASSAGADLVVYCFGAFRVLAGGRPLDFSGSGRAREVFQYLVMHRDRPVPRETLLEELWPDPRALAPDASLRVATHLLRRAFRRVAGVPRAPELRRVAAGYQLGGATVWLDVEQFERCCAQARRLEVEGRATEALAILRCAEQLYQGDFLPGSSAGWVLLRREGLRDQYLFVLQRLVDATWASGDYEECILRCQQLLALDRCHEETYRVLLRCHARLGQRGRVRHWYELCVRMLRTELGVAPASETHELFRRIVAGSA